MTPKFHFIKLSKMKEIVNFLIPYAGIVALIGTYCLIIAYDKYRLPDRVRKNGKTAQAIVTEIYKDPGPLFGKNNKEGYAPIVEFDYPNGSFRYASTTFQNPSPYKVGDTVTVWYSFYKSKKEVALQDDLPPRYIKSLVICGLILCILSYPIVISKLSGFF